MRDKLYLTPAEAAAMLGIERRTLYDWINAGRIPAKKFGRKSWRIPSIAVVPAEPPTNTPCRAPAANAARHLEAAAQALDALWAGIDNRWERALLNTLTHGLKRYANEKGFDLARDSETNLLHVVTREE